MRSASEASERSESCILISQESTSITSTLYQPVGLHIILGVISVSLASNCLRQTLTFIATVKLMNYLGISLLSS